MEADDVMLRKGRPQEDSGDDLPVLDDMIVKSRNKPLSKEDIADFCPQKKGADVGLVLRPWATVKMIDTRGDRPRPVVFVGVKGTF